MPSYQDSDAQWRGGSSESYGTADLHHHVDQTPPPPPVPQGYGYDPYDAQGSGPQPAPADGWQAPRPYAREGQVVQDRANDAAHRADRARTADLNRRPRHGYNAATSGEPNSYAAEHAQYQAELAAHARDMQRYQDDQAAYRQRLAGWHERTAACRGGDAYACDSGPD
jgi:hypothetical protein